ncbi:MAG: poly-beta-1,6-N-acetyl-D-glucosamine synthase [Thermodesulfobacteriota bacterium]
MSEITVYVVQRISDFIFLYPLLMSIVWMIGGIIFYWRLERKVTEPPSIDSCQPFSIVLPCHNEGQYLEESVSHLLELDYSDYEIILVDDGSSDNTAGIIRSLAERHQKVRAVYMKENMGKGAALNMGSIVAMGEFILTMDADALLDHNALKWLAWHFEEYPRVGAITGNPRVLNRTTLLSKIQTGEYATIIGLIKRSQRILGKVLTVSGVIAAFRKQALISVRFWDNDMLTDDIDITWKLETDFWDIRFEPRATCWVRVPETLRGLWKQRLRWAQGGLEVLLKYRSVWLDWRQRRLWPIYIEYLLSLFWAYSFWLLIFLVLIQILFRPIVPIELAPPIPPLWTGAVLAFTCLVQFAVSLCVDHRYEKNIVKYLFWVIWYPFVYWIINALTIFVALPKCILEGRSGPARWESPDRGIDTTDDIIG